MRKDKALLFEFEDLPGFPNHIRQGMVDYLCFFLAKTDYYKPIVPLIAECIKHTAHKQLVDLCSGGGGPILQISRHLNNHLKTPFTIKLTDKFPNIDAYQRLYHQSNGQIRFEEKPIDATAVPTSLAGVRICFSALHHFSDNHIRDILSDATAAKVPVAFFDGGDKNIWTILGIALVHPLIFVVCTPFLKPFRLRRLLFTYLIPAIPVCTVWDGIVSILRLHAPAKLEKLAKEVDASYVWKAGKKKNSLGFRITYLVGYPCSS